MSEDGEIKLTRRPNVKVYKDVEVTCTVKRVGGLLMFLPMVDQDVAEMFKLPVVSVAVMLVEKFTEGYGGDGEPSGELKLSMKRFDAVEMVKVAEDGLRELWDKATADFYERQEVKDLLLVMKESLDRSPGLTLDEVHRVVNVMLSKLKAVCPPYNRAAADRTLCRLKPFYDPIVHESMERLHSVDEDDS